MKTMTCAQMGGECDVEITMGTEAEMIETWMTHIKEAHPELSEKVSAMSEEDMDAWIADFHTKWQDTAENDDSEIASEEEGDEAI